MRIDAWALGEAIAARREELGLTQPELAKEVSTSRATVARLERGGLDSIAFGTVERIAEAVGYELDYSLGVRVPELEPVRDDEIVRLWEEKWGK